VRGKGSKKTGAAAKLKGRFNNSGQKTSLKELIGKTWVWMVFRWREILHPLQVSIGSVKRRWSLGRLVYSRSQVGKGKGREGGVSSQMFSDHPEPGMPTNSGEDIREKKEGLKELR